MPEFVRPVATALSLACLAGWMAIVSGTGALAQAGQQPPTQMAPAPAQQAAPPAQDIAVKQIALTERQIEGVLSAAKDMDNLAEKLPENGKPDPKLLAQFEDVARKNGFASYDEYNVVIDNIGVVLGGFDPATKKYVGPEAVIKAQIARVEADKKMAAKDRKEVLAELNDALKTTPPPVENKGNIDLVAKYYDKLAEVLGEDQE